MQAKNKEDDPLNTLFGPPSLCYKPVYIDIIFDFLLALAAYEI